MNLDEITLNAAKNLGEEKTVNEVGQDEISDDWLNEFENQARLKSSDDMKIIFGKILSGEICCPGTFSIRTIKLISQLDNEAAKLFQTLCNQAVSLNSGALQDARVISFNSTPGANSLGQYGLSFISLNVLQEYGLIISDYNSWKQYSFCVADEKNSVQVAFTYANKKFGLVPTDKEKYDKALKLNGVAFTKSGRELRSIISIEEQKNYTDDLVEFFKGKHLTMVEIKNY